MHRCVCVICSFRYLRCSYLKPSVVNQKNTVKSMIPIRWLRVVPPDMRDIWADRIVEKFEEDNPELFSAMEVWTSIPEEIRDEVVKKVLSAADAVHQEMRDESR